MRIVLTTGYYDKRVSADFLIDRRVAFRRFAEELQTLGHDVLVVYPFKEDAERIHNDVRYLFVRANWWARGLSFGRTEYELATRALPLIERFQPDVIHFSGLTLDLNLWLLTRWAQRRGVPVAVQYHGGEPARHWLRRWIQQGNVRRAATLLFTAQEQAAGFTTVSTANKVVEFTEMSSDFRPNPTKALAGNPVLLCVCQLVEHKDPLTILRAMVQIVGDRPNAHLYWAYHDATLLPQVEALIANVGLTEHVTLLGKVPHAEMAQLYNSAAFFIQASTRDVASIALLEAMACGVTPILSDIPAFRRLTADGTVGHLFTVGNAAELANAIKLGKNPTVQAHFDAHHSYPALARQLVDIYQTTIANPERAGSRS